MPPRLYGGTERVVAYLTDERVRLGHEFEVLHFHIEPFVHSPLFRGLAPKALTTLHAAWTAPTCSRSSASSRTCRPVPRGLPLQSQFVGELGERDKPAFLGNATGLLFPIDWPEPFGLAMIEAMSCGNRACASLSTTGSRTGRCARTISSSQGSAWPSTCL